jgi:coenzyme F420 hydrogenase subunit beta
MSRGEPDLDPDAPRLIEYAEHAEQYGTELDPHEAAD